MSMVLAFCVVVVGTDVADVSLCLSTDVVLIVLMDSLCVSEVCSVSFGFVDWLVFLVSCKGPVVLGRNCLGPALILGRGAL